MAGRRITRAHYVRLDELEDNIYEDLATGLPVTQAILKYKVSKRIWYGWLEKAPGRMDRYLQARRRWAEHLAEETLAIADSSTDPGDAAVNKLRIDTRKWLAGRVDPDSWADKAQPAVQISLQSEHLNALKDISRQEPARESLEVDDDDEPEQDVSH